MNNNPQRAYLLVLPVEEHRLGISYPRLPLYCTLALWFYSNQSPRQVMYHLEPMVMFSGFIELLSTEPVMLGKDNTIKAHAVQQHPALMELHHNIHSVLTGIPVTFRSPEYVGEGYFPHVTDHGWKQFEPGSRLVVDRMYIVEAENADTENGRRIIREDMSLM